MKRADSLAASARPTKGIATSTDAPAAHTTRGRLIHWARLLLIVAVVFAAGYALWSNYDVVRDTLGQLAWTDWVPSLLVLPLAILASTWSWQLLVDELGEPIGVARGGQIFLVGQLGKYLPGSVWAYVLQIELGRRAGLARARIFTATLFSLAVAVVAALLAGSLVLPGLVRDHEQLRPLVWLYLLLPVGLICLHPAILQRLVGLAFRILRRPTPDHPVRTRAVALSLFAALCSYGFFGLHLWLLVRAIGPESGGSLLLASIGTMAIAMISGLFFFLLPSGAGVRELIIVTALAPTIGTGEAVALAAVSRVLIVVADLVTASAAAGVGWWERRRHGPIPHDAGIDDDEA
jgi:hypothetical protein